MSSSIMLQGTMSNVGKSLLTAALCRIFREDGYSVAPFKSQNMALNSFVTPDGLEIGRAQAMQAEAAGTEPSALMNPILLKPGTDMGSQVIVNGRVRGNMRAVDYFKYKKDLIHEIMDAYRQLARAYDLIVIEGAGSPVELNLKKDDIVNMGLAKLTGSPVLLVGDIDRGGVFAQLLGTLMLLEPEERQRVKALIVNKFRGDRSLFDSGVNILEERSGKPVAGVVPWIETGLEDEDSLSEKLTQNRDGLIDIAVIRLPRISNFTDFDVFFQFDGVGLRFVSRPSGLGEPDLLILPGTKSTVSDMNWLRETGFAPAIQRLVSVGTPVFGICGGYQLLGRKISDLEAAEGGGETAGLGLLNIETRLRGEKLCARTRGRFSVEEGFFSCLNGAMTEGYEIHMGETRSDEKGLLILENGRTDGVVRGSVCGTYLHGVFDRADVSGALVKALFGRKGLKYTGKAVDRRVFRESKYKLLAAEVRRSLDMDMIYKIIREGA